MNRTPNPPRTMVYSRCDSPLPRVPPRGDLNGCPWHDVKSMLRSVGLRPTRQRMSLGWLLFGKGDRHLSAEMLYEEATRAKVPVSLATIYNTLHQFTEVGLLLRMNEHSQMTRTVVSGRVMRGERVRDALYRHLEKDLGPMAFPQLPASPVPFHIAEYFPIHADGLYSDDRQHAVSLCYIVPVTGTCDPRQDALELTWLRPEAAASELVASEMEGGRGSLVRAALAHCGALR